MSTTLEQVREKFPTAKYAPRDGCRYCDGTGERTKHPGLPCICAFVQHDLCDMAAETLAECARKALDEMRAGEVPE